MRPKANSFKPASSHPSAPSIFHFFDLFLLIQNSYKIYVFDSGPGSAPSFGKPAPPPQPRNSAPSTAPTRDPPPDLMKNARRIVHIIFQKFRK